MSNGNGIGKKRFILRNWKKIIFLIILIGGGRYYYTNYFKTTTKSTVTYIPTIVKRDNIENSIKVIGTAQLIDEQKLRFNQVGKVVKINFVAGTKVKKGDIIAELDKTDILNTIKQAEINLTNSRIKLKELLKGPEQKDLLKAQNDISSTEDKLKVNQENLNSLLLEKNNSLSQQDVQIKTLKDKLKISQAQLLQLTGEAVIKVSDLQSQITSKEQEISNKTDNLNNLKSDLELLTKTNSETLENLTVDNNKTIETAYTDIRKNLIDINNYLISIDELFGISETNKNKTNNYSQYLAAKNYESRVNTENQRILAQNLYDQLNTKYQNSAHENKNISLVQNLLNDNSNLYDALITLSKNASIAIKASIAATTLTQSQIDSNYNNMSNITSQSQTSYDKIKNTMVSLEKLINLDLKKQQNLSDYTQKQNSIKDSQLSLQKLSLDLISLKNNLKLTKQSYNLQIAQKKNEITDLNNQITKTNNDLDLSIKNYENKISQNQIEKSSLSSTKEINNENFKYLNKGSTQEQINLAQNDITKQELVLENSKKNISKYELEASFDGVVRKIDFAVGDNIVADEQKFVYLENPDIIQITASLDQLDIVKVNIGQLVKIKFDAYSQNNLTGNISEINTSPVTSAGVTSYTIKITLNKGQLKIFSGMTAQLNIIIETKENVLKLPAPFVEKNNGNYYVLINKNIISSNKTGSNSSITGGNNRQRRNNIFSGNSEFMSGGNKGRRNNMFSGSNEYMTGRNRGMRGRRNNANNESGNVNITSTSNSGYENKKVEVGISTTNEVEIISGLNEGDTVYRKIDTSKTTTQSSLIPMPGGGGRGGPGGGQGGGQGGPRRD